MKLISDLATTKSMVDYERKLFVGIIQGDVILEDYKKLLICVADLVKGNEVENILIDRQNANKVDAESRIWVKDVYIKEHMSAVNKVKKVAVVQTKSAIGSIHSKALYSTLSVFYPNLTLKPFKNYDDAMEWVKSDLKSSKIETAGEGNTEAPELLMSEGKKKSFFNKIFKSLFS